MILQQPREALARAGRVAGEHRPAPIPAQRAEVIDHGLVDVRAAAALGREIARAVDAEIEHGRAFGLVERRHEMAARGGVRFGPFRRIEVERLGRQRAIAACLGRFGALAVLVIVGDRVEALLGRLRDPCVAHHHGVTEMIE